MKRFKMDVVNSFDERVPGYYVMQEESPDGEWVRYADVEATMSIDRFEVSAKLIVTTSKVLTKEEKALVVLLTEQRLNALPYHFLDELSAQVGLRVHVDGNSLK